MLNTLKKLYINLFPSIIEDGGEFRQEKAHFFLEVIVDFKREYIVLLALAKKQYIPQPAIEKINRKVQFYLESFFSLLDVYNICLTPLDTFEIGNIGYYDVLTELSIEKYRIKNIQSTELIDLNFKFFK